MKIAIITIGDELLIGQVVNKNASWIAEQCTAIGATVFAQSVVGDAKEQLVSELDRLVPLADVIITTGGLGPTHDDITKDIVAEYTNDKLVLNEEWLSHLKQWSAKQGRELTERNASQAMVPSKARVLHNAIGTAPGLEFRVPRSELRVATIFHSSFCIIHSLPGVPSEMQSIMKSSVLPELEQQMKSDESEFRQYKTVHTTGIAESNLADLIGDTAFLGTTTLAFLPSYFGVRLRIGAVGKDEISRSREIERVVKCIVQGARRFLIGDGSLPPTEFVAKTLIEKKQSIAVAESCTGGMLGEAFTDLSGSSEWFMGGVISYSNNAKVEFLGVDQSILDAVGAVSEEVAIQMAEGVRREFGTAWGIGVTGIAGPTGGTPEKPVGTVWISVAGPRSTEAKLFKFGNDRRVNRERSVGAAVSLLIQELAKQKQ